MKPAVDYDPNLGYALLLQGPPKTGKTILTMQWPGLWIADCDNNLSGPIRWLREKHPEKLKDVMYDTINMGDDGKTKIEPEARWSRLVRLSIAAANDPKIQTIALDGLSSISDYLIDHIVNEKADQKAKYMTISDWQPYRSMLSKLIVGLRTSKKFVIMTCHDEYNRTDDGSMLIITPNIPSKLAGNFGGFFSDVWHTETEEKDNTLIYKVRTMPRPTIPSLGNSLGLPKEFQFKWEDFAKNYLYKNNPQKG